MQDDGQGAGERRARSHPLRVAILDLLAKGELTAAQVRAGLPGGPPLGSINYHLRVLKDNRLVTVEEGCYKLP